MKIYSPFKPKGSYENYLGFMADKWLHCYSFIAFGYTLEVIKWLINA